MIWVPIVLGFALVADRLRRSHPGPLDGRSGGDRYGGKQRDVGSVVRQAARQAAPYVEATGRGLMQSGLTLGTGSSPSGGTEIRRAPKADFLASSPSEQGQRICYTWIEYLRIYHPERFDRSLYITYELSPMNLADECAITLDKLITEDAFRRGISKRELKREFTDRLKADGKKASF